MWRIFYADGTTFGSDDGEPKDAPGLGVIVIVQEHETPGERAYLQHMTDYYIWLGNKWQGCDRFACDLYHFYHKYSFEKAALSGQTISNDEFYRIGQEARKLRDKWNDPTNVR